MKHISKFAACSSLIALSILSGCAAKNNGFRDNAGVDSIHKANVAFEERSHPISFADGKLSANENASLQAFIAASGLTYADRLTLRLSEPNMAPDYRQSVNMVLGRFGLSVGNVEAAAGLRAGTATLTVSRATVTLPQCGVHNGNNSFNFNNENMNNFGCASRSNLAAMAANPADLINGNTLDGQSSDVTAKPIENFGAHKLTGYEVEDSGTKKTWTPQGPLPK
jgi:pilus assembly protein CpaD